MKFRHNKKRNTAFIYEILIVELSKATMAHHDEKKNKSIKLLKKYFSRGKNLKKDLNIYRSFEDVSDLDRDLVVNLIQEAKNQFNMLNRKIIFEEQTKIISEINKNFGFPAWDNFVSNYKKLATVNQVLNKTLTPKKQVLVERKLISLLTHNDVEKKPFPNVNNLAVKTFIENFNKEYGKILNEEQKKLLEKYITSYGDDEIEFKMYLYEEIDRLKNIISEKIEKGESSLSGKLQKILNKMNNYSTRALDQSLITEVVKIQSLTREIN